jgi:hypothetical protein
VGTDVNIPLSLSGKGTGNLLLGTAGTTVAVGAGGSALTNGIVVYAPSLTPVATAAAIGTTQQTFTVTGLSTSDKIYVNSAGVPTSLCPMTGYRVSALNTLQLDFTTLTAVACTPAAGTYNIIAIR